MNKSKTPVIDFHVHMLERSVFTASTNKTVFTGFGATPSKTPRPGTQNALERMYEPLAIIEDLDTRGIDIGVLTVSTVLQGTSWADVQTDLALCRSCNEQAARWQADHPTRFVGSFVLPLQDPAVALKELDRCLEMAAATFRTTSAGLTATRRTGPTPCATPAAKSPATFCARSTTRPPSTTHWCWRC